MNGDLIKSIFSSVTGVGEEEIIETLERNSTDGWDSFNHLMLIMELENRLGIKLLSKQAEEIYTYGDLLKYFNGKQP